MIAVLYAIAILGLLLYGGNWLWLALVHARAERLRPGPPPDPEALPDDPAAWPIVTVQLPLYNEADVAERLIDACARFRYPKDRLEIQILDDSTDETTALARRRARHWRKRGRDVSLLHRSARDGYKAGALKNGLRLARGTLVAIFDADFVPPPDFLLRAVPELLSDANIGMVQARWGHLNAEHSPLTQEQAFGLDAHFALEQHARQEAGCFINFNGTAGVWRRRCIAEAGGWTADTLTEDLDLSYRAQLRGWRLRYLPALEASAELPAELGALRTQQYRWAKGAIETARKLLGPLWRSAHPLRTKLEGTLHLTAHLAYPLVLLAVLTHPVLIYLKSTGAGPSALYFAAMGVGMIGFAGFFLAHLFAQRALYPGWLRRLRHFPLFAAGTIAFSFSNTRAVVQGLLGRRSAFVRTPKTGANAETEGRQPRWTSRYAGEDRSDVPAAVWGEGLLALYSLAGLGAVAAGGQWAALPFQALFAASFMWIAAAGTAQSRRGGNRSRTPAPASA